MDVTSTIFSGKTNDQNMESITKGICYLDRSTGEYYYQAEDGSFMTMVQTSIIRPEEVVGGFACNPVSIRNENVHCLSGGDNAPGTSSVGTYQSVTIVPNDNASSGVNYVLIVPPPAGNNEVTNNGSSQVVNGVANEAAESEGVAVFDFDDYELKNDKSNDTGVKAEGVETKQCIGGQKTSHTKRSQTVAQSFMCNYCNYVSQKPYLLSRHMKSHSNEKPYKCLICERGFKTSISLLNHVNTHTGVKPHACSFCDSKFNTSGEVVRHVRYKHTNERPHSCPKCDYQSVESSKLRRHLRCHTGERPFQCTECSYSFPDMFKLKRHIRIHTGEKPYGCDICGAQFTQSNSLKSHRQIHSGNKPIFQCSLCPTTCGRKTDLRLHFKKLHISDLPLACLNCGKTFADRYTLKIHRKTHVGQKCFMCHICPYKSASQRALETHSLIHSRQKPFKCDCCNLSFRQKQLLKRHQNVHHNPHYVPSQPSEKTNVCEKCYRKFRHKGNLIRHMSLHESKNSLANSTEQTLRTRPEVEGPSRPAETDDSNAKTKVEVETACDNLPLNNHESLTDSGGVDYDRRLVLDASGGGQHYVVLQVLQKDLAKHEVFNMDLQHSSVPARAENIISDFEKGTPSNEVVSKQLTSESEMRKPEEIMRCTDVTDCFGFNEDEELRKD